MATGGIDPNGESGTDEDITNIPPISVFINAPVQNLQIGGNNTIINVLKTTGKDLLNKPKEAERKGIRSDDIIVAMVKSLLIPKSHRLQKEFKLQTVESSFSTQYGNLKSFKEVTGIRLLPFLRRNKKFFLIRQEGSTYMVMLNNDQSSPIVELSSREKQDSTQELKNKANLTKEEDSFLRNFDHFKMGHYILITSTCSDSDFISSLADIPWLIVFDFDKNSRRDGLLMSLETNIEKRRNLQICSIRERAKFAEKSTVWCCCRDNCKNGEMTYMEWYSFVKKGLQAHIYDIAQFIEGYSKLYLLVLWPVEDHLTHYVRKLVEEIVSELENPIQHISLCLFDRDRSSVSEEAKRSLESGIRMLRPNDLSLDDICMLIADNVADEQMHQDEKYDLPSEILSKVSFDRKIAVWLDVDLEVLYKESLVTKIENISGAFEKDFLRGGHIPWCLRYQYEPNSLDVERYLFKELRDKIKTNYIDKCNSKVIKLLHAPGSGGTTLARRILFELKDATPCVEVRMQLSTSIQNVAEKMKYISEQTNMPVVAMVDGDDDIHVEHLFQALLDENICCILLHVKRNPYLTRFARKGEDNFYLQGEVTKQEAAALVVRFKAFCENEKQKHALDELKERVERGETHFMYEFGLTAYLHNYKGISSFIRSYIPVDPANELQPWHKVLGFLSLIHFYGQIPIPIEFLSTFSMDDLKAFEQIPKEMQHIVIRDFEKGHDNMLRITHYVIAKEILNHLLLKGTIQNTPDGEHTINDEAKKHLNRFALEFIEYAMQRKTRKQHCSSTKTYIYSKIFILRDNRDDDCNNKSLRTKKPLLSKLLLDIPSSSPYTERLEILEKLTIAFPNEPNFLAHLGRFYSIFRPEEEEEAEKCFKSALALCKEEQRYMTDSLRHTMMLIHDMFGQAYKSRIGKYTGFSLDDRVEILTQNEEALSRIQYLIGLAQLAIEQFMESRKMTPSGQEKTCAVIGEIKVRLQVVGFIHRFLKLSKIKESTKSFIEESLSSIDKLAIEYCSMLDMGDIDSSFFYAMKWYTAIFEKNPPLLTPTNPKDTSSVRVEIAATKLKHRCGSYVITLDDIKDRKVITDVVGLLETLFSNIRYQTRLNTSDVDHCYKDWILAIRNPSFAKSFKAEEVLKHVRQWDEKSSSTVSKFYVFVLMSVIGFGSDQRRANPKILEEAKQQFKKDLQQSSKVYNRTKHPIEWLGSGDIIKDCLIPGIRFQGQIEDRVLKYIRCHFPKYMKGTIHSSNGKKMCGYIKIDLGEEYLSKSMYAFFVPLSSKLEGSKHANTRVEFILGFSIRHGYEAYNVKPLDKYECKECNGKVEMTSDQDSVNCKKCQSLIIKEVSVLYSHA